MVTLDFFTISNDIYNFFQWLDLALPKHYKDMLWNMKLRIDDLLVRNGQVVELQKKVEKHKLLRKAEKELAEARIQELLIKIERLKNMLKKCCFDFSGLLVVCGHVL
uniref:Uncharacterized protein n=1 Tax=Lactuca sativa TaxID=4236 RepID=A0A9R1UEM7_LACSA|nr:hypothetical protein LSAT_V11C900495280 [Lactuca sativa]